MANYIVKDVRAVIEDLDDDTPLFGFIIGPKDIDTPTPAHWERIVEKADNASMSGSHTMWDAMWDIINDAKSEVWPDWDGEEDEL